MAFATGSYRDVEAVDKLRLGYLLAFLAGLGTIVTSAITDFILTPALNAALSTCSYASCVFSASAGLLYAAFALGVVGPVIGMIAFYLTFLGFGKLKAVSVRFASPSFLSLFGLAGFGLIMVADISVVLAFNTLSSCFSGAGSNVLNEYACLNTASGSTAEANILIVLGALLLLFGIVGNIMGNLRAGSRYHDRYLKIGGALLIVWIGSIILWITYGRIQPVSREDDPSQAWAMGSGTGMAPQGASFTGSPVEDPADGGAPGVHDQPHSFAPTPMSYYWATPAGRTGGTPNCSRCGSPTTWVAVYKMYYCYGCEQYL